MNRTCLSLALFAAAAPAMAQSNVDQNHKYSWSENCGYMNWRDAGSPAGGQGVRMHNGFLSGYIWGENVGWITVGDGTPANGVAYANATGPDTGVNILPNGDLAGFAWGENIGWINFSTASLGAQRARLDAGAGRLRGFAWGENIGWVNLNDADVYVGIGNACYANCDGSAVPPILNVNDFVCFQQRFAAADPYANCDSSTVPPILNVNDFVCFQQRFAAGCP